ncbi:methyl-accepting chemotaxis protein [Pleionea sediminis]|uniref:methyl-accepting chemotaxis protein n=1 Tax=Pleionea sediminis TaxID=2569479 RepID=UPI0013DE6E8F|nr:methyl-accepting chemotaxis protein [Pleionea sediminis]
MATQKISQLTREKVEAQVAELTKLRAEEIRGFFVERARVPKTVLTDPRITEWLTDYDERGSDISNDIQYRSFNRLFNTIVRNDPTIKSLFVGSAKTFEYFYEEGRVGVAQSGPEAGDITKGYFTNKRPWWHEALKQDRLYLGSPQVDATDKTVSSTLQMTVYNQTGELVGIGGVDILITTIGELVNQIRYQGKGRAFLLDENQHVVYFPVDDTELELNAPLADFDHLFTTTKFKTEGFKNLSEHIANNELGKGISIIWKNDRYQAFYVAIQSEEPLINWTLGLLIPNELIEEPIVRARTVSFLSIVAIIFLLTLITYFVSKQIFKPVKKIAMTMKNVAQGEGDLTQRLEVLSSDEVGEMAIQFNQFADKIQELVKHTTSSSEQVSHAADRVSDTASKLNKEVLEEREQMANVSRSVTDMSNKSEAINRHALNAIESVSQARDSIDVVAQNSSKTQDVISQVSRSISDATESVVNLNDDVGEIGTVLDVIKNIAEQTNLLALNAAIEAARAGEQGRGFAVVADEVRVLATRTQESTEHIQATIEKLQSGAMHVKESMEKTDKMSSQGEQQVELVLQAISTIQDVIQKVNQVSSDISSATSEQKVLAQTIEKSLDSVHRLTDLMAEHSGLMDDDSRQLNDIATELRQTVNRFKIE